MLVQEMQMVARISRGASVLHMCSHSFRRMEVLQCCQHTLSCWGPGQQQGLHECHCLLQVYQLHDHIIDTVLCRGHQRVSGSETPTPFMLLAPCIARFTSPAKLQWEPPMIIRMRSGLADAEHDDSSCPVTGLSLRGIATLLLGSVHCSQAWMSMSVS